MVVVYLQSRIPVAVEPEPRSGPDSEMGLTDTLSSWKEMIKEVVGVQRSSTDSSVQPRPLVLPAMVETGQSSSTLPIAPRQYLSELHSVPSRHHSLPAFKHGNVPLTQPLLALPTTDPLTTYVSISQPQTPSSHSYSTPSSANPRNPSFNFGPSVADIHSPRDHRWRSKHLSMMPTSPSSPGEMQNGDWNLTTPRSTRVKLTKPLPAHYM